MQQTHSSPDADAFRLYSCKGKLVGWLVGWWSVGLLVGSVNGPYFFRLSHEYPILLSITNRQSRYSNVKFLS